MGENRNFYYAHEFKRPFFHPNIETTIYLPPRTPTKSVVRLKSQNQKLDPAVANVGICFEERKLMVGSNKKNPPTMEPSYSPQNPDPAVARRGVNCTLQEIQHTLLP